jgi:hypothetical protein
MKLVTINNLTASVWMLYGLHFDSRFAMGVGLLWMTVYIVEMLLPQMNTRLDRLMVRSSRILEDANRNRRDAYGRFADLAPSDYDTPRKA